MVGDKSNTHTICRLMGERTGYLVATVNYRLAEVPLAEIRQSLWWATVIGTILVVLVDAPLWMQVGFLVSMVFVWAAWVMWVYGIVPHRHHHDGDVISQEAYHMQDVTQALHWLRRHVHHYGGQTEHGIHLLGHSAGAHLTMMLALKNAEHVQSSVCISGVYSDIRLRHVPLGEYIIRAAFGHKEEYFRDFPIHHVHSRAPPTLLLNAVWDLTLNRHAWDMFTALREHGAYVRAAMFNADHFTIMRNWSHSQHAVLERILAFWQDVSVVTTTAPPVRAWASAPSAVATVMQARSAPASAAPLKTDP